jgi:NAD+ synthase
LGSGERLARKLRAKTASRSRGLREIRDLAQRFRSLDRYDTIDALDLIVEWTAARLEFSRARSVIFGASGGVDSSLVACILARAAKGRVTAFVLPCGSKPSDEHDARALCAALGIPVERIDLQPAFDALRKSLSPAARGSTAEGNLKTRLRTTTLFHEAQVRGALHVGTGDLDEGWVGYYTKGSASDLAPIGSLHKREVRSLLKLALTPIDAALARRLSRKPADAGLSGRTAEQDLGVSYDHIADALEIIFRTCHVYEGGLVPRDLEAFATAVDAAKISPHTFEKVAELIYRARHKAFGAPVLWRDDSSPDPLEIFQSE